MNKIYFIWTKGFKGTACEKLYGLDQNKDSHSRDKAKILQQHELPLEHTVLNLEQLAIIYPYNEVTQ